MPFCVCCARHASLHAARSPFQTHPQREEGCRRWVEGGLRLRVQLLEKLRVSGDRKEGVGRFNQRGRCVSDEGTPIRALGACRYARHLPPHHHTRCAYNNSPFALWPSLTHCKMPFILVNMLRAIIQLGVEAALPLVSLSAVLLHPLTFL